MPFQKSARIELTEHGRHADQRRSMGSSPRAVHRSAELGRPVSRHLSRLSASRARQGFGTARYAEGRRRRRLVRAHRRHDLHVHAKRQPEHARRRSAVLSRRQPHAARAGDRQRRVGRRRRLLGRRANDAAVRRPSGRAAGRENETADRQDPFRLSVLAERFDSVRPQRSVHARTWRHQREQTSITRPSPIGTACSSRRWF